jgi:plasmid stabilization system protein ParE
VKVRWPARAAEQLLAAVEYLESERQDAGRGHHDTVRETVAVIRDHPPPLPIVPDAPGGEAGRALLRRWRYWLVFEVREADDAIVSLSAWNTHRRPEGWHEE